MKLDAINDETGRPTTVIPVALQDAPGHVEYSALALYDLITGRPIRWCEYSTEERWIYEWHVMDDDIDEAETVIDVYGEDEAEWRIAADAKLADHGFRLGMFVPRFAFKAGGPRWEPHHYDGYLLEEA